MAYGKPIVASQIGGIPELVREGKTGLLFDPGNVDQLSDKITLLLGNRGLREAFGRKPERSRSRVLTEGARLRSHFPL